MITLESGKITDYLHHVDLKTYGAPRMTSVYLGEFDDGSIILDCGSSNDINRLLRYMKNNKIDFSSIKYLTTSHCHFDHVGGMWKLYETLQGYNPDLKILTNQKTMDLLNDFETHLNRAKRTYGNLVGIMKPIKESAFEIIEPSINFSGNANNLDAIKKFTINGSEVKIGILKTAGHTHDSQSPIFIKDGSIEFIFLGEAAGTIYHSTKLVTMPTSMPIYFNYKSYMETLENLKKIFPLKAGYSHFGVVNGKNNVREILLEHINFMKEFRAKIIEFYEEKPETKYVVEKIMPILNPRSDMATENNPIFKGIALGIVYGMLMDLGYRES